jgi:hypothetical protein
MLKDKIYTLKAKENQGSGFQHLLWSTNSMIFLQIRFCYKQTYPARDRQFVTKSEFGGKSAGLGPNEVLKDAS